MKKILVVITSLALALTMVLGMSGTVMALDSKVMNRYSGMEAYANWEQKTVDSYWKLELRVAEDDEGTRAFVTLVTVVGDVKTLLVGAAPVSAYDFTIEDDLSAASLSEISVDLYSGQVPQPLPLGEASGPERTITISAIWTGTGELVKNTYRTQTRSGDFSSKTSMTITARKAEVTGVLDGSSLGATSGQLTEIKYASMSMDK